MRLDPASNPNLDINRPKTVQEPGAQAQGPKGAPGQETSFEVTSELEGLIRFVEGLPDVRDEAVAEARANVDSGELLTPEAAGEVAEAFLNEVNPDV